MAKTKKRYYRRKSKYRILRNYFKAKLDTIQRVALDSSAFKLLEANGTSRNLHALLQACGDWVSYTHIFHSFKLTGIALTAIPNTPLVGANNAPFSANGTYAVGIITSTDPTNFTNLIESNCALILTPSQTLRKYMSFNGGQTGWLATSKPEDLDGKLYCETNSLASQGGMVWTLKITLYVTFKNPS